MALENIWHILNIKPWYSKDKSSMILGSYAKMEKK